MKTVQITTLAVVMCLSASTTFAGNPSRVGDITGRNLAVTGLGAIGHIGTWNGSQVVEVLNENPVIQFNTLSNFQNRSNYWGARGNGSFSNPSYINVLANTQAQYTPSYTLVPLKTTIGKQERTCNKVNSSGQCLSYSTKVVRAVFRCDTFVDYLYQSTGNGTLYSWNAILPVTAYNKVQYERK